MATADTPLRPITVADEDLAKRSLRGRIVVIDDDHEILSALQELLELQGYACNTYSSAQAYLQVLNSPGPVSLALVAF